MSSQPPVTSGFDPVTGQPLPVQPATQEKKLLAPIWHTVLISLLMLSYSAAGAWAASRMMSHGGGAMTEKSRIIQYSQTIVVEFLLLFFVWLGMRLKKATIRDLIGGRWDKPEAFLIDCGIAFGFWVVAY